MAFSTTVRTLRHDAARRIRDLWTGTLTDAAAVGALSIRDHNRVETTGYFSNAYLYIGTDRTAESHRVQTNGPQTITMANDGGLLTARAIGVAYEMHKTWSVEEYNGFIHDAIKSMAGETSLASLIDESLEVETNAGKPNSIENEYTLPSGFRYISGIWMADDQGYFQYRLPAQYPHVQVLPGAVKTLQFSEDLCNRVLETGRALRIVGQGDPALPTLNDSSVVALDPDFIVTYVEEKILAPIAGGTNARAVAAQRRLMQLPAMIELKRVSAIASHRVIPGSLVVPS